MKSFFIFLIIIKCSLAFSQELSFTVLDEDTNIPLEYVGVEILGTHNGIYTNNQGEFQLENSVDSIQITHIGYYKLKLKVSGISDIIFLKPKSEMLDEVIVNNGRAQEKTIGYIGKNNSLSWTIKEKNELTTLVRNKKNFKNSYIKNIYIPIGKSRIELVDNKAVESSPKFNSTFRVHLYSNKNNEPGENLLKTPILIKCNQDSDNIIEVNLENEFISYPEEGVFIGVEMIGLLDEQENVIHEKSKSSILPSFKFTKQKVRNVFSVSYTKAKFLGTGWVKIDKNSKALAHISEYNMAVSLTLDVYEN
ncbi:carboxypeptidase-like regulatory domain-containing protein [Aureibaculum algae]|uniref:Carboxypeptidase-like regulatory domain-containing protein n=1 Tax=Aureibaculum algae TaxID=2584122 RepID=A0A5B7TS86_9FLAO|nr:carboxypeptidase-like regulatory domain-containing protein [Aureibaculum algae]QCX39068.1 carboxypeptidase-like regulatory domain-containing protein [Aureibaculum algae]